MDFAVIAVAAAAVLNVIVFFVYGSDKRKAIRKQWRTPESTLIACGFFAPWGAIAGMQFFRHKTQKPKFRLNYLFAVLHIVLIAALIFLL